MMEKSRFQNEKIFENGRCNAVCRSIRRQIIWIQLYDFRLFTRCLFCGLRIFIDIKFRPLKISLKL